MVCLSGGKDSKHAARRAAVATAQGPIQFSLIAVNLDQKQPDFPPHVLPDYLKSPGRGPTLIEQDTYSVVKRLIPEGRTMCSLCSRMRRGALDRYEAENGIIDIALGDHRDDIVETLLLNLFFGGKLKRHGAEAALRVMAATSGPARWPMCRSARSSAMRPRGAFDHPPASFAVRRRTGSARQ